MIANLGVTDAGIMAWLEAMIDAHSTTMVQVLQIIGIDILLAGDNAVVIALACRSLPPEQRRMGIILGVAVAIIMRVVFAAGVSVLMGLAFLKLVGGLLLFWIAIKLLLPEEEGEASVGDSGNLWSAVKTIAVADLVMSLDNVVAIAAVAKGNIWLIAFGLIVSIPLIVAGAALILGLLTRYPILIWGGAGLLGWIAGELIHKEIVLTDIFDRWGAMIGLSHSGTGYAMATLGVLIVIFLAWFFLKMRSGRPRHPA